MEQKLNEQQTIRVNFDDANMKKRITLAPGTKISIEATEAGSVITFDEPKREFKVGDYVRWNKRDHCLGIISSKNNKSAWCFNPFIDSYYGPDCYRDIDSLFPASETERKKIDAQMEKIGKRWNPETQKIEDISWEPKEGERYYYIGSDGEIWDGINTYSSWGKRRIKIGNCFKTADEVEPLQGPFEKLFNKRKS